MKLKNFPTNLLPNIYEPGTKISNSINVMNLNFPSDTFVALGDLQCSFFSCLEYETDCGKLNFFFINQNLNQFFKL